MSGCESPGNVKLSAEERRRITQHKYYVKIRDAKRKRKEEEMAREKKVWHVRVPRKAVRIEKNPALERSDYLGSFVNARLLTTKSKTKKYNFQRWGSVLEKHLCVYVRGLFPSSSSIIGPQINGDEIVSERSYVIVFKNKDKIRYLYEVRKSQIPRANMGLFALRRYSKGDIMGVFFGKIVKKEEKDREKLTCYAMELKKHGITIDMGGIQSKHPAFFGLHFANDPSLGDAILTRKGDRDFAHNFFVDEDLVAIASLDIEAGDELFLNYNFENGCDCRGCLSYEVDFGWK
jgi:hypothetical protein